MRRHCYQATQRPNMTTDQPPLLMAHIDPDIGPNISTRVQGVGAMCA